MNKLKTILVGVDFSECSRCALEQAVRLTRWNNTGLRIIHAMSPTSLHATDQELQQTLDELRGRMREHAPAHCALGGLACAFGLTRLAGRATSPMRLKP